MKTTEQQELETQLLKKRVEFYNLTNAIIAASMILAVVYGIYRLGAFFWG